MPIHRVLRWLLRLDQPVIASTDADVAAEVERNYRWNLSVNLAEGVTFWAGRSFVSTDTILPLFISKLTTSPLPVGLLGALAQGGWFLPQLVTANAIEQLPRKKPVVINLGFFLDRLPFWVMAFAALLAGTSPKLSLGIFMLAFAWRSLGAGAIATAWQDLVARCIPVERRGRLFGITRFAGAGAGTAGAALCVYILDAVPFPTNFVYIFAIAAALISTSWAFLALTREPVPSTAKARQSAHEFWKKLPQIVRHDDNFRRFLVTRFLMALGGMGGGFITVAAIQNWDIPNSTVGIYTGALLAGQTVGNLVLGFLADRFGHKLSLVIGALSTTMAFILALLSPAPEWYYAVFTLQGIYQAAIFGSGLLIVMEFSQPERRPTYIGLANTGIGVISGIAPLLGAGLATLGYSWLFALCAAVNCLATILMCCWVREPRQVSAALASRD